ncbi:MAG: hypothetical protein IKX35_09510 [Bacteroidales bacterium]|nr:hypothetical protein [Bacteroidales bacterium]
MTQDNRVLYARKRAESLRVLREKFRTDEIDEEEIRAECEAVRVEMYEERMTKKG